MIIKITDFRGGTRSRVRGKTPRPPICEGFGACPAGGKQGRPLEKLVEGKTAQTAAPATFPFSY